jgi:hypothetical protein
MNLTERIKAKQLRKAPDLRPVPMWRRRIEQNRAKELVTFQVGSYVPAGSERGA